MSVEAAPSISYFEQRMQQLGIEPDMHLIQNIRYASFNKGEEGFRDCSFQIFQPDDQGNIRIYYPDLNGNKIQYKAKDNRWSKDYYITRLAVPKGDMKYALKRGSGTNPFLTPGIIRKYQAKEKIKNLFFTEGAIKAFVAGMYGLDIIGFTSITHLSDTMFQQMYDDVKRVIETCGVERCIWLVDGDCNRLSNKPIKEIEDLYKRPNLFFRSGDLFRMMLSSYDNIEKWFVHPLSDELPDMPKGIDDVLLAMPEARDNILADLQRFDKKGSYDYFKKINISFGVRELKNHFRLNTPLEFYLYHVEQRKQLLKAGLAADDMEGQEFTFNGTQYRYNPDKSDLEMIVPADAKNYFRVGDVYHEKVQVPNKYKLTDKTFHRRLKQTIIDDNGANFIRHIPKYKAFCVVPDHQNHQEVINNCYNLYAPFEHEPEEGEIEVTMAFLEHIFGKKEITFKNPKTGETEKLNELDLGLDYVQLLYQQPTQMLPILCLVSRENNTGKSTFGKWLRMIFTQNVAIVGNAELADNFNASWASKLLVICDEAKIDKQVVVEKVKSLSTADKVFMNAKGKDHVEIDFFAKFIFQTNNEENFIYASEEDVRYWIRKIPRLTQPNVSMLLQMQEEIPAFLHFLNHRKLRTDCLHRAWFHPDLIRTEALMKVIAYSQSTLEKELRQHIRDMFLDFPDLSVIEMTKKDIKDEFFKQKNYEMNYLQHVIVERLGARMAGNYVVSDLSEQNRIKEVRYNDKAAFMAAHPELNPDNHLQSVVKRYSYHRWEMKTVEGGKLDKQRVEVSGVGRPFIFHVSDYLLPNEINNRRIDDPELAAVFGGSSSNSTAEQADLPF